MQENYTNHNNANVVTLTELSNIAILHSTKFTRYIFFVNFPATTKSFREFLISMLIVVWFLFIEYCHGFVWIISMNKWNTHDLNVWYSTLDINESTKFISQNVSWKAICKNIVPQKISAICSIRWLE